MAKCEECMHRNVCEKRTCSECSGGFGCDDCEIYHTYDGKPSIENCKHFRADETEVKRGKWIPSPNASKCPMCSLCGAVGSGSYCHHCGAKMTAGGVLNDV